MFEIQGKYTKALMTIDNFEEELINQVHQFISHPAFTNQVVVMPDGHAGKGSCVGFTMPMSNMIVPSTIGVDIGCGVTCANVGTSLNVSLEELDKAIRENIPMGTNINETIVRFGSLEKFAFHTQFPWKETNLRLMDFVMAYNKKFGLSYPLPVFDYRWFVDKCNQIGIDAQRAKMSISSIGSGNHFYSLDIDSNGNYWSQIHSGSRNYGKCVCEYYENIARKNLQEKRNVVLRNRIEEIKNSSQGEDIQNLIEEAKVELGLNFDFNIKGTEFLTDQDAFNYLVDMVFAQAYASFNRKCMLDTVCEIMSTKPLEIIESIHNYIDFKDFIVRKGAISSYIGEKMIIPLNMRDGSLICEGKSNPNWNFSAPHGAGRTMSRSKAKQTIDLEVFKNQMVGICSSSVCKGTLDEAPDAYKDSKMIEEAIAPTAIILNKLTPVLNIKDKSSGLSWKEIREAKKNKQNVH